MTNTTTWGKAKRQRHNETTDFRLSWIHPPLGCVEEEHLVCAAVDGARSTDASTGTHTRVVPDTPARCCARTAASVAKEDARPLRVLRNHRQCAWDRSLLLECYEDLGVLAASSSTTVKNTVGSFLTNDCPIPLAIADPALKATSFSEPVLGKSQVR